MDLGLKLEKIFLVKTICNCSRHSWSINFNEVFHSDNHIKVKQREEIDVKNIFEEKTFISNRRNFVLMANQPNPNTVT